jgi:enoyl-CoA hydratase/carnithine racemase
LSSSSGPGDGDASPGGRLLVDEPAPGVARLTISNPGKRGALDHAILDAFTSTLAKLDAKCLIVTGEQTTFSAGYDIGDLRGGGQFADEADRLVANPFAAALEALEAYRYPTLAALNGHAIGGGLELALACDLRIAASTIAVGMPPAKLGLVYSHTGIRKFIDTIGAPRTRELFLVGRRIDARTAREWGLVNAIAEEGRLAEQALELAREIAANAPLAQQGNKRVIRAVLDAQSAMDPDTERELIELRRACFASEDFREGVRAFSEKRAPRWLGR